MSKHLLTSDAFHQVHFRLDGNDDWSVELLANQYNQPMLRFSFYGSEGRGQIDVSPSASGLSIDVDGRPACLIDVFHPAHNNGPAFVQLDAPDGGDPPAIFHLGHPLRLEIDRDQLQQTEREDFYDIYESEVQSHAHPD